MKSNSMVVFSLLAVLALMLPANMAEGKNVKAVTEVKIQLVAAAEFKGSKGYAKIKTGAQEQEFEVEAQLSKKFAGQVLGVTVGETVVGTMTVSPLGKARLELNSKAVKTVPVIHAGALVGVVNGDGTVILAGQF